jgi:beta-glucuronidase
MLYPRESETRQVKELSGIWQFHADFKSSGLKEKWYESGLPDNSIPMPVPASFNDITQDISIRDFLGTVWYERSDFIPTEWKGKKVSLWVGAAAHRARVWVNGRLIAEHIGGFLPFAGNCTQYLNYGKENRIVIAVDNILSWDMLPPGKLIELSDNQHPEGFKYLEYYFDFFNYAGIHRPVRWVVTPLQSIEAIKTENSIEDSNGICQYNITAPDNFVYEIKIRDSEGSLAGESKGKSGIIIIKNVIPWEPLNSYLYTFEVSMYKENALIDVYRLPVGFRSIEIRRKELFINGKPFYFKGFGKHEDSDLRGRGLDHVLNIKDFNLLKWIGANSFRTSHYPYSEEIMNLADQQGIAVIDECPAVGMHFFKHKKGNVFTEKYAGRKLLHHHKQVITGLIERDCNHPSVIAWSVANEAATFEDASFPYFKEITDHTRKLDSSRPVMSVLADSPETCKVCGLFDLLGLNCYFSWYSDPGRLDIIEYQLKKVLKCWWDNFKKPVIITEFGADTIPGYHQDPPVMFSEEYQAEMIACFTRAIDKLDFVIGEHIWNFADFATKQGITRVMGNKKGVFTRNRQPKMSAHWLRKRWTQKMEKG